MKQRIIDSHMHIGDIFIDQRNVIFKKGLTLAEMPDPFTDREERGFTGAFLKDNSEETIRELVDVCLEKSHVNSLERIQKNIDENVVDYVCMLPILPAISFEDTIATSLVDERVLPCTCVDFSLSPADAGKKLLEDYYNGALMLKLHPVINNVSCTDPIICEVLKVWEKTGQPVVIHCGTNQYYYSDVNDELTTREFGEPKYVIELAKMFPELTIVAAHGGGMRQGNLEFLGEAAKKLPNLYTDTTFRSADDIKVAIDLFGKDRVLFGTDFPFGNYAAQINQVKIATEGDQCARDAVFFGNVSRIMGVDLF